MSPCPLPPLSLSWPRPSAASLWIADPTAALSPVSLETGADDGECVGEGGSGGEAACVWATSTLTPTNLGPPILSPSVVVALAAAADDELVKPVRSPVAIFGSLGVCI